MESAKRKMWRNRLWYRFRGIMAIVTVCLCIDVDLVMGFSMNPYIADLMVDFGMTTNKKSAGWYTAGIASCFFLGNAMTSLLWGVLSDRIGRRKCLLISAACSATCSFALMFTYNYWYLLALRFLQGLLSCLVPISKTQMGENASDDPKKGFPRSWLSTVFNLGAASVGISLMIGPLFGGLLSRPVQQYPSLFANSGSFAAFLRYFPLFLPNLCITIMGIFVFILILLFIDETNEKVIQREYKHPPFWTRWWYKLRRKELPTEENIVLLKKFAPASKTRVATKPYKKNILASIFDGFHDFVKSEVFSKNSVLCVLVYFCISSGNLLLIKTYPILYSTPVEDGGFGLSPLSISILSSIFGASFIASGLVFPFTLKKINAVWLLRIAPVLMCVLYPFIPELNYLLRAESISKVFAQIVVWIVLIIVCGVSRALMYQVSFGEILFLTNNCVTNKNKAKLQGVASIVGGLGKAFGPLFGNLLLAAGLAVDKFPMDIHFSLVLGVFFFFVVGFTSMFLPTSLAVVEKKKKQKEEVAIDKLLEQCAPENENIPGQILDLSQEMMDGKIVKVKKIRWGGMFSGRVVWLYVMLLLFTIIVVTWGIIEYVASL